MVGERERDRLLKNRKEEPGMKEKGIVSMLEDKQIYEPSDAVKLKAYIKSLEEYQKLYDRSTNDLKGFWGECADRLDWYK